MKPAAWDITIVTNPRDTRILCNGVHVEHLISSVTVHQDAFSLPSVSLELRKDALIRINEVLDVQFEVVEIPSEVPETTSLDLEDQVTPAT